MTVNEFKLPDVGEGLTEAEIVTWLVKEGDTIKVNDIICEIETAKSLVELPSPYAGVVSALMVTEGQTVPVGTPIISVASGAAADQAGTTADRGVAAESEIERPAADHAVEPGMVGNPAPKADGATPTLVGYGPRAAVTTRRARKTVPPAAAAPPAASLPVAAPVVSAAGPLPVAAPVASADPLTMKVLAKPPVRKLAKDLGVDLATLTPTGPGGTITRADVEARATGGETAREEPLAVQPARPSPGQRETRIPIKGVRKMTAQAMVSSAFTAPHVTEWITFDATKTMRLVDALRDDRSFAGVRVSPLLIVARAVCLAARRTPEINSSWDEAAQEIVLKHYVNLGIAAATPRGLVVPNIKGADSLTAVELAGALAELTSVARSGKTPPADMTGGTFTITNVGVFGVDAGTPILNPGESAILAMGAVRKQPWVVGDKIKARWVTTLALSFDHRVVDGQQGSRFLADVASILEAPGRAILF